MHDVWLGLGANIGDRLSCIEVAIEGLSDFISDMIKSPLYETAPRDFFNQPDFLNGVIRGKTDLEPRELLECIHVLEKRGGRVRSGGIVKGPRTIDIDILYYDNINRNIVLADGSSLTIPHRSAGERLFVLRPVLDIDPDKIDPVDNVPLRDKVSHLSDQRVKLYRT